MTPTRAAEPERSVVPGPMAASTPVRVQIPAIDVDSELMGLGLQEDGTMEVPPAGFPAGWYVGAPTPGELGPAIIAGHVRWRGPGVFRDLEKLRPGDEVIVTREDGSVATFRATRVENHLKSEFPTQEVYGDIDHVGLRLITCGGLDPATRTFNDNVIVFAELVGSHSP
ncbi:class F sortase [Nocardioides limicola]|uniref:class F sortase n=1 Tax=Nocardioides limicola TaxID=2803368 RepID=UPI00193B5972|nr:class F sortase [Nocardioides sp. DJM-14]